MIASHTRDFQAAVVQHLIVVRSAIAKPHVSLQNKMTGACASSRPVVFTSHGFSFQRFAFRPNPFLVSCCEHGWDAERAGWRMQPQFVSCSLVPAYSSGPGQCDQYGSALARFGGQHNRVPVAAESTLAYPDPAARD